MAGVVDLRDAGRGGVAAEVLPAQPWARKIPTGAPQWRQTARGSSYLDHLRSRIREALRSTEDLKIFLLPALRGGWNVGGSL
jgi:hypothetical protein